ncbi:hypothetical protein FACS1894198_3340 [Clostridia bacterium]|nr:hypothetical protein FACS1894198_3340 [Clostridia bacterium]
MPEKAKDEPDDEEEQEEDEDAEWENRTTRPYMPEYLRLMRPHGEARSGLSLLGVGGAPYDPNSDFDSDTDDDSFTVEVTKEQVGPFLLALSEILVQQQQATTNSTSDSSVTDTTSTNPAPSFEKTGDKDVSKDKSRKDENAE